MGAVSALLASCLDQAMSLEALEHGIQQQMLRPSGDQTSTELGQHAEVEARVRQFEPERVFPVNAAADGISGLPVTEVFQELKRRDQSQPPWCQARLAAGGIECTKILVLKQSPELVAQTHHHGPFGESRVGNTCGFKWNLATPLRMQA